MADVTPGMISKGTPARANASASSPPRPKTKGSPPLRRTTRLPRRAGRTRGQWVGALRGGALPHEETRRPGRERERLRRDESVVEHDVRLAQGLRRLQRQETRVSGSGAH